MQTSSHEPTASAASPLKRNRTEEAPSDDIHRPKKARESQELGDIVTDGTPSASYTAAEKGKHKMIEAGEQTSRRDVKIEERNAQLVGELGDELRWVAESSDMAMGPGCPSAFLRSVPTCLPICLTPFSL